MKQKSLIFLLWANYVIHKLDQACVSSIADSNFEQTTSIKLQTLIYTNLRFSSRKHRGRFESWAIRRKLRTCSGPEYIYIHIYKSWSFIDWLYNQTYLAFKCHVFQYDLIFIRSCQLRTKIEIETMFRNHAIWDCFVIKARARLTAREELMNDFEKHGAFFFQEYNSSVTVVFLLTLTWTPSTLKIVIGGVSLGLTLKNSFPPAE